MFFKSIIDRKIGYPSLNNIIKSPDSFIQVTLQVVRLNKRYCIPKSLAASEEFISDTNKFIDNPVCMASINWLDGQLLRDWGIFDTILDIFRQELHVDIIKLLIVL